MTTVFLLASLLFLATLPALGGGQEQKQLPETNGATDKEDDNYDPWRESNQPKLFVDYLNGPLSGKTHFFFIEKTI